MSTPQIKAKLYALNSQLYWSKNNKLKVLLFLLFTVTMILLQQTTGILAR